MFYKIMVTRFGTAHTEVTFKLSTFLLVNTPNYTWPTWSCCKNLHGEIFSLHANVQIPWSPFEMAHLKIPWL